MVGMDVRTQGLGSELESVVRSWSQRSNQKTATGMSRVAGKKRFKGFKAVARQRQGWVEGRNCRNKVMKEQAQRWV